MNAWSEFWKILIIVSLVCFALLSVFVMIGGFRDVLAMFRRIDRQHEQSKHGDKEPDRPASSEPRA